MSQRMHSCDAALEYALGLETKARRLTRERDEARAEVAHLRTYLRRIAESTVADWHVLAARDALVADIEATT